MTDQHPLNQSKDLPAAQGTAQAGMADFIDKVKRHILHADDGSLQAHLRKVLEAAKAGEKPKIHGFWKHEAKELAKELEEILAKESGEVQERDEDQPEVPDVVGVVAGKTTEEEQVVASKEILENIGSPAADKIKESKYRKLVIKEGKSPFREGTKNDSIFKLLLEGKHTKEEIAEQTSSKFHSVGYLIWIIRKSGYKVTKEDETGIHKLEL